MTFVQTIRIETDDIEPVNQLLNTWHDEQAGVAPGYQGARVLADEDQPRRFVIEVDFSSKEEAQANDGRPETRAWADKLAGLVDGDPEFTNLALVATTS